MTTNQAEITVLVFFGYALQFMRGFSWFNDLSTLGAAFVAGLLAALLGSDVAEWRPVIIRAFELVPTILGGTLLGHMGAHLPTPIAPRFNSFSKETTDEAPPAAPGTAA
jgi:hypothetical protein